MFHEINIKIIFYRCINTFFKPYIFLKKRIAIHVINKLISLHRAKIYISPSAHPYPVSCKHTINPSLFSNHSSNSFHRIKNHPCTDAFLIYQKNNLVYEYYSNNVTRNTPLNVWSMTKTIVTTLLGVSIRKGFILSIDDSITSYLPELKKIDRRYEQISLRSLALMRSGIQFSESYHSLFSDSTKLFFKKRIINSIANFPIRDLARTYQYAGINIEILSLILESATGMSLAKFCENYLWNEIGAEHPAYWWSEKTPPFHSIGFSGFMASSVDLMKIGKLHLDQGYVDLNKKILDPAWISLATNPPEVTDSNFAIGWRRLPEWKELSLVSPNDRILKIRHGVHKSHALLETKFYYCAGFNGQYMVVYPDKDLILLRLGRSEEKIYPCINYLHEISNGFK